MKVAVIGGGIQGICVAMELASRGVDVELIEANHSLMDGASRHNEGKIHLGFVYANDPSFRTADLMFLGAMQFSPLMRRWLGDAFYQVPVSTPFNYAVHKRSLLSADQLQDVYDQMKARMRNATTNSYFSVEDPGDVVRLGPTEHEYGPSVETVFATREVAVDPRTLADLMSKTVSDNNGILILTGTTVMSVDARSQVLEVLTEDGSPTHLGPYDHIINCAWGGRPALDSTAGLHLKGPWTFRMKYFLLAMTPPELPPYPSTTVVLGSFGDIVNYGNGEYYLSWYPSGRRGWSNDLNPPQWPTRPEPGTASEIVRDTLANLEFVVPGLSRRMAFGIDAPEVLGGLIYAQGDTDVDDPDSGFHQRSGIGLHSKNTYHSVNTGKYTTAPLFAMEAADRITGTT